MTEYKVGYASVFKRFLSYVCDCICLACVAMLMVSFIAEKRFNKYGRSPEIEEVKTKKISMNNGQSIEVTVAEKDVEKLQAQVIHEVATDKTTKRFVVFITFIYYLFFTLSSQQATLGQRFFHLMTVRIDGNRVTFQDALNRIVLLLLLNVFAVFCIFSKKRFTVYDYLSKTMVVEVK